MNLVSSAAITGKIAGQFFTPEHVAKSLVSWVVRTSTDRLLDPSCGEGAMLAHHGNSRGIEQNPYSAWVAHERLPHASIENTDFFTWASTTTERFECAAGNPPFIRYQSFKGLSKAAAASICNAHGVSLSGLSSAWPSFIVATATLLLDGGHMAFVVPAEIGHATYAVALLDYLVANFTKVQVVAVRDKLFPHLSEDCWILYCEDRGGVTDYVRFAHVEQFNECGSPPVGVQHRWADLKRDWRGRLRPLILPPAAREAYLAAARQPDATRFGDVAKIGIGYISGANDFFHLTSTRASELGIPDEFLIPSVRRGKYLKGEVIDQSTAAGWQEADEAFLLLSIPPNGSLHPAVARYLDTEEGLDARRSYKCRTRSAWFSVPGVVRPDYFLQYMSGSEVRLARNDCAAACTNSVHAVQINDSKQASVALGQWGSPLTRLSCELEGHPLGGGMLKLEPREASRIVFAPRGGHDELLLEATRLLKSWRHN
ncbi:SAM-dependent DNA methyltransferase (plasmid) [Rhizobium leguminosarum]|uniref:N-6 DNA methylase n=1 Tax=Rhizobium leguminosarum TaxID=384 RepID=UPI001030EB18|nr:N-6 DNA methylase [Rhizobium leguminosarum]TAY27783.1 SAM-dependent DNA methyltransferase [Rhizobium leguminosarum]